MYAYDGTPTELEHGEIERLRRTLAADVILLMLGRPEDIEKSNERQSGSLSEQQLSVRLDGVDATVPWKAVTAHAASPSVMVLAIGQLCVPIARSLFRSEEEWQLARAIVEKHVLRVPTRAHSGTQWRTLALWLALLTVIFLAWHFAQPPRPQP